MAHLKILFYQFFFCKSVCLHMEGNFHFRNKFPSWGCLQFSLICACICSVASGFSYKLLIYMTKAMVKGQSMHNSHIKVRKKGWKSTNLQKMLHFNVSLLLSFHSKIIMTVQNFVQLRKPKPSLPRLHHNIISIQMKTKQLILPKHTQVIRQFSIDFIIGSWDRRARIHTINWHIHSTAMQGGGLLSTDSLALSLPPNLTC